MVISIMSFARLKSPNIYQVASESIINMNKHANTGWISAFILAIGYLTLVTNSLENMFENKLDIAPHQKVHSQIAFGILIHDNETYNGMLEFVDKLYHPNHCYVVHADWKYNGELKEKYTNVHIYRKYNISWGSFNLTKSMLYLTNMAYSVCKFDVFQFVDGTTYPLHSLEKTQEFYDGLNGNVVFSANRYLKSGLSCVYGQHGKDPCKRTKSKCLTRDCLEYSNTPRNRPIYKGMQWVTLQYEFIHYMMNNAEWLTEWIQFFGQYRLNDEMFFQTIVKDANATEGTVDSDVVQTLWGGCKSYWTLRSSRHWSPCIVGQKEYKRINWNSLFIRKLKLNEPVKERIDGHKMKNKKVALINS
eukprot:NODE_199_length_15263_cov_0.256331.p3 type:complete len:360 gc:universal NODE_199_length_15263_cov_0.256331:10536-11615(+)